MATTILQWNIPGLRCNRRDFDILVSEQQPDVVCLQETKLEHSPPSSHYQCDNYDCYFKSRRRNPYQLPCGGVSIYIKKGLYHHQVQMGSHLQAVAVQVTLGDTLVTILYVYIPSSNHLTSRDLTYLTRNIRGQILITGDFNWHSYLWGSHDVDTRGEVIERFTNKHNLCILNDGTHTYLKTPSPACKQTNISDRPHNFPTRTCPDKCVRDAAGYSWQWPLSHTDFHPTFSDRDTTKLWSFSLVFFPRPIGKSFMMCLESISEDILEEADPLHSFVEHITKAANDCIPRATTIPKKSNP